MADTLANKTYKDQYHFKDKNYYNRYSKSTIDDLPSLNVDPEINTIIKENPFRANVEIEKNELVLEPDLSALYKARGKTHAGGGIDVNLKPDSFIFSNDKSLAFTEDDQKLFEFKTTSSFKKIRNTPAEVLKRNIDVEHYNRMVANIQDPAKDELAKRSSIIMLEKYIQTLGNIAFLQEEKKRFPDGLPPFSAGTAPVYHPEVKDSVDSQKQFAKYGGKVNNPYLPEFAGGGPYPSWLTPFKNPKTKSGRFTSQTGADATYPADVNKLRQDYDYWKSLKGSDFDTARDFQNFIYDYNLQKDPASVATMWSTWGQTNGMGDKPSIAMNDIYDGSSMQPNVDFLGRPDVKDNFLDKPAAPYLGARTMYLSGRRYDQPQTPPQSPPGTVTQPRPPMNPAPEVPNINGQPQGSKSADWEFTPWQKLSHLYSGSKYASTKRYMPMRSRFQASYIDPSLVNPEQTIADAQGAMNTQVNSLNTLNPVLRNAQAAGAYGQFLNQLPGIRSQYDNQNAQIINQTRAANNQIRNNETMTNMQNDAKYYQESVVGRQNFDNMKSYLGDQFMSNIMDDVSTNQSLAYNMMTINNPAYGYNFRKGNFYRNPKNILDVPGNNSADAYKDLFDEISKISDPYQKATLLEKAYRQKNILPYLNQPKMKKGGNFNPYR